MFTRQQYMNNECTHRQYYAQFVTRGIRSSVKRSVGLDNLVRCSDQEYFNTIPLRLWDVLTYNIRVMVDKALLASANEGWSLSTGVCIAKEAARQLVEEYHREECEAA